MNFPLSLEMYQCSPKSKSIFRPFWVNSVWDEVIQMLEEEVVSVAEGLSEAVNDPSAFDHNCSSSLVLTRCDAGFPPAVY